MDTAPRRLQPEGWAPTPRRKVKAYREPREERVRIPDAVNRMRTASLNLKRGPPPQDVKSQWSPSSVGSNDQNDIRDPEVVDIACPKDCARRGASPMHRIPAPSRTVSPSATSQYSTRQSEISFGILDYYISDRNSLGTPEVPPLTPRDSAIDKFDFGLTTATPRLSNNMAGLEQALPGAKAETQRENKELDPVLVSPSSPSELQPFSSQTTQKKSYTLFPAVKEPAPTTTKATTITNSISPQTPTIGPAPSTRLPTHSTNRPPRTPEMSPHRTYRPRKDSLPSPHPQMRKDSFTSLRSSSGAHSQNIRLRIVSHSTSTTTTDRSPSSAATAIPPHVHASVSSRWSAETITSSTAAAGFRPVRENFSSLLGGRESAGVRYLDCFFDDDDDDYACRESARRPLRRKLGWGSAREGEGRRRGRFVEEVSFGRRVGGWMLCCRR